MVAFGKKILQWGVPEWKDGYTDYEGLKEILEKNTTSGAGDRKFEKPFHPLLSESKRLVEAFPSHFNKAETLIYWQQSLVQMDLLPVTPVEIPTFPFSCLMLNDDELHIYSDSEFLQMLELEIEKSNDFYCEKLMLLLDKINEIIETKDFRKNKATIKECYRGIQLLHNFRVLNFTSWVKIMKKYNKYSSAVPEKDITRILEFMKRTPLVCNNKLFELQMKIEEIYRRFFHPEITTRAKLLEHLRPMKADKKISMFFSGIFLGTSLACVIAGILFFAHENMSIPVNWEIFHSPFNRMISIIVLSLCMWSLSLNIFGRYHICTSYILEAGPGIGNDSMSTFEVASFLLSTYSFINLIRLLHNYYGILLGYIIFLFLLFALPFKSLYWRTKKLILITTFQIAISPFGPVHFRHFFLCDQFCSFLSRISMDFLLSMTYLWFGNYKHGYWVDHYACFLLRPLPYIWRFLQCMRRFYFTKEHDHLVNAGKYATGVTFQLLVAFLKSFPIRELGIFTIMIGFISMIYCLYWDFIKDWGLFQTNNGLRDNIIYPKYWYYIAIAFNIILRLVWTLDFVVLIIPVLENKHFFMAYHEGRRILLFGMLEASRRGMWNIFRMENEVVNNAGKFRALNLPLVPVNDPDDTDVKIEIS